VSDPLRVRVLFFASYADLLGRDQVDLAFQGSASVADVVQRVRSILPGGNRLPERPLVAVNQTHAKLEAVVADGDELAFLPPMAGG